MKHEYRNPLLTVDIIIEIVADTAEHAAHKDEGIVLVERKNPPYGWALPGGFVDYGESMETAAVREAKEETSLDVTLLEQFYAYSAVDRDPRHHTVTTVFIGRASGVPRAMDDAKNLGIFNRDNLPDVIAFDHAEIIQDYYAYRTEGKRPDARMLHQCFGQSGSEKK